VNRNADEWKVVSGINPKNTIRQIARANKSGELNVYGLISRPGGPPGVPLPPPAAGCRR
jgi:hypothetical protein